MRKIMFVIPLAAAVLIAPADAASVNCRVADPTGTPLNIRLTPNGQVVARARNGEPIGVFTGEERTDGQGRLWYYVALPTSAAPDGYALAAYIRCPR